MIEPQRARELIHRCRPRGRFGSLRLPMYVGAGVLFGILLAEPQVLHLPRALGWAVPLAAVLWIVMNARRSMHRQLSILRQWTQAGEAVQLEEWPAARRLHLTLLSQPVHSTTVRTQGLLGLAAVADHYHEYRTSQLIYEHVLTEGAAHPIQLQNAATGLATAMLHNEEVTGAVQLIDQLARSARDAPRLWQARVELVRLHRELVMGQYDDLLDSADRRRALFRECLSTHSGYGYALLALAFHRRGRADRAGELWNDATVLIPPDKLLGRFPMLAEITQRYPACEVAL